MEKCDANRTALESFRSCYDNFFFQIIIIQFVFWVILSSNNVESYCTQPQFDQSIFGLINRCIHIGTTVLASDYCDQNEKKKSQTG